MDHSQAAGSPAHQPVMKHAYVSCSRRKIRCDRRQPCASCVSHAGMAARRMSNKKDKNADALVNCVYVDLPPAQRHRRRPARATPALAGDDLLDRLRVYEDLLQKNKIATPEVPLASREQDSAVRSWIASPWEAKMGARSGLSSTPALAAETPSSVDYAVSLSEATTETDSWPASNDPEAARQDLDLWQSLAPELRNLPVSSVFARRFFGRKAGALTQHPATPTAAGLLGASGPTAPVQHPDPQTILRLWQIFVDSVNPILRIVHVPTTAQQVVGASWDAANAPPATGALLFSIYALSLTSLPAADYADMFGSDEKSEMLARYRMGATQCLAAAGLLTTRRIEVLRAFTLLILAEPDSELASSLAALAVHLGLKMGLHREPSSAHSASSFAGLSFFEREMRVRLWWQIRGIDARMRQAVNLSLTHDGGGSSSGMLPPPDAIEIRLPLNVNDADLHPDMASPPVEHTGPTEMMYVRMKYETALWMRAFAQKTFASVPACDRAAAHVYRTQTLPAMKDRAIDELENMYLDGCLRHCDMRIPLHAVTASMARMAVAHLRFQAHHPRLTTGPLPVSPQLGPSTRHNSDAAFQHALDILELCFACRHVPHVGKSFVAFQLLADIVQRVVMDALVYIVWMLRVRTGRAGGGADCEESCKLETAWRSIEMFYDEYGDDMAAAVDDYAQHRSRHASSRAGKEDDAEDERKLATGAAFVTALTDLVLEAWDARTANVGPAENIQEPAYIVQLREQRVQQKAHSAANEPSHLPLDPMDWSGMVLQEEPCMDWEYWSTLIQI